MAAVKYKRILLKLSGEALAAGGDGILNFDFIDRVAEVLVRCRKAGVEIGVIVGAGNIWRGRQGGEMDRTGADHMGMLATAINALALQDRFNAAGLDAVVMSAVAMPEFADAKAKRYNEQFGLSKADAELVAGSKHLAELFEKTVELTGNPKEVRYWLVGQIFYLMNEKGIAPKDIKLSPDMFAEFVNIASSDRINKQAGKIVFEAMFMSPERFDIEGFIKENGLEQVDDTETIRSAVRDVINNNPKTVQQYLSGQTKVVGFFVGQVMKATGGKAKPDTVNKLVNEELNKL